MGRRWRFLRIGTYTARLRGIRTGISEASKRVPIFSFATQGGKQPSSYFRQRNWVRAREAQIRFPASDLSLIVWSDPPACVSAQAPRFFVIYDSQFPLASSRLGLRT